MSWKKELDLNCLEVFGGVFESEQSVEEYMKNDDGVAKRIMEDLYLQGDFIGTVEYRYLSEKTNEAEKALSGMPYGDKIVEVLKAKFADKFKRKINTIIVLYDFHLGNHFSRHNLRDMKERKTDNYYIFNIANVFPYK